MSRALAVILALGGCGFQTHAVGGGPEPDAPEATDARGAPDAPMDVMMRPPIDGAPATGFCDPADPHLVACYELEGDAHDGSSHHLDATTASVTFPDGEVGAGMLLGPDSTADVADSTALDITALTIEAWIKPTQLPPGGSRATIIDVNMQYALFVEPGGDVNCVLVGGPALRASAHIATNAWAHVACTYDGSTAVLYLDGLALQSSGGGQALHTGGTTGLSIGWEKPPGSASRLIGLIDQLRIFDLPRTPAQLCVDAEQAPCP